MTLFTYDDAYRYGPSIEGKHRSSSTISAGHFWLTRTCVLFTMRAQIDTLTPFPSTLLRAPGIEIETNSGTAWRIFVSRKM